ncbi:helix-turn-helix transcriptional regulator [Amycolatopsis sp., V23-08]|uniref:Helix-turn-helix transcriptional regulator n=1 Tax=Amycolatopsis heterodermiae TaxID=3110235 RepID=A0ABU5R463_9PSEU|nr:helix-turn-helix transcriptional regulator [Amycolatopsis sp., V23-08]MEA5361001.1 helix-turn-helix transcriptional regulator [Amycolatopsis sp., V23-08]
MATGVTVIPLWTGQSLVLAVSDAAGPADFPAALLTATAGIPLPPLVVLDLRDVRVLPVHAARAVVAFVRTAADSGTRCVLLPDSANAAARAVLDVVDPAKAVPRAATLEQALGGARTEQPSAAGGRTVHDVADTGAAEELLNASYGSLRLQTRGEQRGIRIASTNLGPVRLDEIDLRMRFSADVGGIGQYYFAQLTAGRVAQTRAGAEQRYAAGDLFFSAEPGEPYAATIEDTAYTIAVIEPSVIESIVRSEPGPASAVRFASDRPVPEAASRTWVSTVDLMIEGLAADPGVLAHPLVVANAARLLAATALATFPNTAAAEPTIEDRHDAHPQTLRRAIAYVEGHADRDIGVADVARAAGVTVRAVQLAFRRHLGLTPMAYLRRVRLDCAHADLRAGIPGRDTVTEIAGRWGFGSAGVFATRYRAAYGELPSQTLRRP